jgi:hypothetical protein
VRGVEGGEARLRRDHLGMQCRGVGGQPDEGDVALVLAQPAHLATPVEGLRLDAHGRHAPGVARAGQGGELAGAGRLEADAQGPGLAGGGLARALQRGVEAGERVAPLLEQRATGAGERDPPARPLEQLHAQLGLQLAHRLAERGL